MVDQTLLASAHMWSCKTLQEIANKKCRRFGLSPNAMLARLRELAQAGIIREYRDGMFHEDDVLEAANKYRPFMAGNVKDLRTLLGQKKPEPDALELADAKGEAPEGGKGETAPLPASGSGGRCDTQLTAETAHVVEGTKPPAAPEAVEENRETPVPKNADTGGISEGRLAVLRDEATKILENHKPGDYESSEEFVLAVLCELERKGVINGGQKTNWSKGPFYVEMLPHAEYVPIRISREFAEFERDIFRIVEKIGGGNAARPISYAEFYGNLEPIFQDPAKIPMGKVFVTKWTRRMAKDMDAAEMRLLDEDQDYRMTTTALRAVTTSICRIICGIENLEWTRMKRHLQIRHAPEPRAEVPALHPQKPKRPYQRKNADFYASDEEIAAEHKSHKFRANAILEVIKGLEETGGIRKTGSGYPKAETREKLREFLERHCSENEVVEKISREFGLTVSGARAKFELFRKSHKKNVEVAMKHGAYDREAVGDLLGSYRSVFEKYSGSRREEQRQKRTAQKKAKETDVRRGKKLIRAAVATIEKLEGMTRAQKARLTAGMGDEDLFRVLEKVKNTLEGGRGSVLSHREFQALMNLEEGMKKARVQAGRRGITPGDIKNLAYVAKAKLMRTEALNLRKIS